MGRSVIAGAIVGGMCISAGAWAGAGCAKPEYAAPVAYGTGLVPWGAAVDDFNLDGALDIVTANALDASVSVLVGLGDGTFAPHMTFGVGASPCGVATGDFNGDGRPDLAVTSYVDDVVSILTNSAVGPLTFFHEPPVPTDEGPVHVAAAALVGDDEALDLVVANSDGESIQLYRGHGDGTFEPVETIAVDGQPQHVAPGDADGDGDTDVVVSLWGQSMFSDRLVYLRNAGADTFEPNGALVFNRLLQGFAFQDPPTAAGLDPLPLGAAIAYDTGEVLLIQSVGGELGVHSILEPGGNLTSITAGNVNGDEFMDLVIARQAPDGVLVYAGNGAFDWSDPVVLGAGPAPLTVAMATLQSAGGAAPGDLAVTNSGFGDNTLSVLLNQCEPGVLGDITGDGVVDVLDLIQLISTWGPCPAPPQRCPADLDDDRQVGVQDLVLLLINWGG